MASTFRARFTRGPVLLGLAILVVALVALAGVITYRAFGAESVKAKPDLSAFPVTLSCQIEPYSAPDSDFGETNQQPAYLAQSATAAKVDDGVIVLSVGFSGILPGGVRQATSSSLGTFLVGSDFGITVLLQGEDGPSISIDRDTGSASAWSFSETTEEGTRAVDSARSSITVGPRSIDIALTLDDFTLTNPQVTPTLEVNAFELRPPTSNPEAKYFPYQVCS
ncbi:hypothetical protein [Rhodococcus sp. IEGM1428]|uniref:hypothetical protein n=1 Tax=Rhodococcus sp. IEGM1428 TaxID=3392191 RepID=UPI003D09FF74